MLNAKHTRLKLINPYNIYALNTFILLLSTIIT